MSFIPFRLAPLAALTLLGFGGAFAACTTAAPVIAAPVCDDPGKVQVGGMDTGFELCTGGPVHRAKIMDCLVLATPAGKCDKSAVPPAQCQSNAECASLGDGNVCGVPGPSKPCECISSCTTDFECLGGGLCVCGDPFSVCVRALCRSDADCSNGHLCVASQLAHCGALGFACQSDLDECQTDLDCPGSLPCIYVTDHRVCPQNGCAN